MRLMSKTSFNIFNLSSNYVTHAKVMYETLLNFVVQFSAIVFHKIFLETVHVTNF